MTQEETPEESGSWKPLLAETDKTRKTALSAFNSRIPSFRGLSGPGATARSPPVCSVFYAAFLTSAFNSDLPHLIPSSRFLPLSDKHTGGERAWRLLLAELSRKSGK